MGKAPFFELVDGYFVGQDAARGPWDAALCHAGPVAAAVAREVERNMDPAFTLVRLTMDLMRPVPMAGFSVRVHETRTGRRLATGGADVTDHSGRVLIRASFAMLRPKDGATNDPVEMIAVNRVEEARPGPFPITSTRHGKPAFGSCVDIRYPEGHEGTPGPTSLWMRTPPLLEGEVPSPFQALCPIADCGNAISRLAEVEDASFMNSDLTIVSHRAARSEWLMSSSVSHWHDTGIGLAQAQISDAFGPIATALQTLVID